MAYWKNNYIDAVSTYGSPAANFDWLRRVQTSRSFTLVDGSCRTPLATHQSESGIQDSRGIQDSYYGLQNQIGTAVVILSGLDSKRTNRNEHFEPHPSCEHFEPYPSCYWGNRTSIQTQRTLRTSSQLLLGEPHFHPNAANTSNLIPAATRGTDVTNSDWSVVRSDMWKDFSKTTRTGDTLESFRCHMKTVCQTIISYLDGFPVFRPR